MNTKNNLITKITAILIVIFLTFGNVVQASAFFSSTVAETTRQVTVIEKDLDSSTEAPQSNQLQGAYDWYVDAINGSDGNDGSEGSPFKTIQKAITIATAGQSVFVANGTYPEKLVIRKDIQITGESRDGTIIDTSSLIDYGVDADGDFITSFANLTLVGPAGLGYGFKINGDNAQTTLSNILVKDSYRTGIDLNGLNSAIVTDVVVENNGGNGFAMTNCSNVTITNITTSGNAWGGVALYTNSTVNTQGSDNVSIVGTNSFGESTAFYTQIHPDYPPTNLNVPDFAYMVTNATDKPNVTTFAADLDMAGAIATGLDHPEDSVIRKIATSELIVVPGLTIKAAINAANPGDTIIVEPGTYVEEGQIVVDKSLTVNGAGASETIIKPNGSTGSSGDARGWWLVQAGNSLTLTGVTLDGEGHNIYQAVRSFGNLAVSDSVIKNMVYPGYQGTGLWVDAADATISNNSFSGIGRMGVALFAGTSTVQNNTFIGNGEGDSVEYGVEVEEGADVTISGNTFAEYQGIASSDGSGSGAILVSSYFGPNSFATISNNTISNSLYGVLIGYLDDDSSGATIQNNTFQYNDYHIYTVNQDSTDITIGENTYIPYSVTILEQPGSVFATIQSAIDAAEDYQTVFVPAGTYVENIVIDKPLTLRGTDKDSVILLPASIGTYCASGSLCDGSSNVIMVEADNVTIHDLTIDGDNPDLDNPRDDALVNGANIDARNGIVTNHVKNSNITGLEVYNTVVKNIFLRGIYMSTNGEFDFHDNIVTNVAGDSASIGLFAYGASGKFTNNTVSLANDAISANHSKGIEFVGNTVYSSGTGIHTDNSKPGVDKFDLIQNNTINCGANGYGIFTFAHYQPPKVLNNTLNGCAVGISAWGGRSPEPVIINNNTIDGQDVTGSVGLFVTTSIMGWGYLDINVEATGNTFENNATAVEVTADNLNLGGTWVLKDLTLKLNQNNMDLTNSLAIDAENDNPVYVEADANWWGSTDKPVANVNFNGSVNFCTWLDAPAPGGELLGDGMVINQRTGQYYCSIQAAVDDAEAGDELVASAGTFAETIVIDKPLTLNGPNVGINPNTGTRSAEAIIEMPQGLTAHTTLITIASDDVVVDGFTLDGQKLDVAYQGSGISSTANRVAISNNIVKNFNGMHIYAKATYHSDPTQTSYYEDVLVNNNHVFSDTDPGRYTGYASIYMQGTQGEVSGNVVEGRAGIQIQPYTNQSTKLGVVENNTITAFSVGIYYNYDHTGGKANWDIKNNTITMVALPAGQTAASASAIRVENYHSGGNVSITGNYADATASDAPITYNYLEIDGNTVPTDPDQLVIDNTFINHVRIRHEGVTQPNIFARIQSAINAAADNDEVLVSAGTYYENVDTGNRIINGLTVQGIPAANGDYPVVKGSMKFGKPKGTEGDYAHKNLVLENLRIEANLTDTALYGSYRHALRVENFENAQLRNLELVGTEPGAMTAIAYGISVGAKAKDYLVENVTMENFQIGVNGRALNMTIKDSDISNVLTGVNNMSGGNLTITDSSIVTKVTTHSKNLYVVRFGEGDVVGAPTVLDLHISNSTLAMSLPENFTPDPSYYLRSLVLRGNAGGELDIVNSNIPQGILNISSVPVSAESNWWGSADKPAVNEDYVGLVNFCTWLDAPAPDGNPVFGEGQVKNDRSGQIYCSIQSAVDDAQPGDVLLVGPGTFLENVLLDKKVQIIGSGNGEDPLVDTIVSSPASFDTKVGLFNLAASGVAADDALVLSNMRLNPVGQAGISVGRFTESTGTNVAFVELDSLKVIGTNTNPQTEQERGLFVDSTSSLRNILIKDSSFDKLNYGFYFMKAVSADTSTVSDLTVTNTTLNHNNLKGIYAEKLNNAVFTDVTVSENGFAPTSFGQDFMSGVDINLKAGTYENIQFIRPVITDNALGGAKHGVGITIKARNDGGYAANPATLNGVLIEGAQITGNERGIRFGEPGKLNAGPTNVIVQYNRIFGNVQTYSGTDGSIYGGLINASEANVTAVNNWWGCNEGPTVEDCDAAVSELNAGEIDASKWLVLSLTLPNSGVEPGTATTISADLNTNSADEVLPIGVHVHNGIPIEFSADVGAFDPESTTLTDGAASSVYTPTNTQASANLCAKVDNETYCEDLTILLGQLTVTDFYYATGGVMKGVSADIKLEEVTTDDAVSIIVKLYTGGPDEADYVLLQTNTANLEKFNAFSVFTSPFDIFGTRNYVGSSWTNVRETEYGQNEIPTRVEAIVTLASGKVMTATNDILTGTYTVVAVDDTFQVEEDTQLVVAAPGIFANDQFPTYGTTLEFTNPTHGTLTPGTQGGFSYMPDEDWFGEDTFTYTLKKEGVGVATATVTITVTPVKDPVQAVDDFYSVNQNAILEVPAPGVLANDIDVDLNNQFTALVSGPSNGNLIFRNDGSFTYTPKPDFSGTDTFVYQLITTPKTQDLWTDEATVTITVIPLPVISSDDIAGPYMVGELREFNVTLTNPAEGASYTSMSASVFVDNITFDDFETVEVYHPVYHTWVPLTPVVEDNGLRLDLGPTGQFPLVPGQIYTLTFRVTFKTAGTYPAEGSLYDTSGATPVEIASYSTTLIVNNPPNTLPEQIASAPTYVYDPAYEYVGDFVYDAASLTYTATYTAPEYLAGGAMNDLARYLGALYRQDGSTINKLTYKGVDYTWQPGTPPLAGSNWKDENGVTLVSVIVADLANQVPGNLTVTVADNFYTEDVSFVVNVTNTLDDEIKTAPTYVYDPVYNYVGTFTFDDPSNTYTATYTDVNYNPGALYDLARYLGALYRQANATVIGIHYNGVDYTWNPNGTNKGSNWEDAAGTTLVSVVGADFQNGLIDPDVTFTVSDGIHTETVTFVIVINDTIAPEVVSITAIGAEGFGDVVAVGNVITVDQGYKVKRASDGEWVNVTRTQSGTSVKFTLDSTVLPVLVPGQNHYVYLRVVFNSPATRKATVYGKVVEPGQQISFPTNPTVNLKTVNGPTLSSTTIAGPFYLGQQSSFALNVNNLNGGATFATWSAEIEIDDIIQTGFSNVEFKYPGETEWNALTPNFTPHAGEGKLVFTIPQTSAHPIQSDTNWAIDIRGTFTERGTYPVKVTLHSLDGSETVTIAKLADGSSILVQNSAPVANNDSYTTPEDIALTIAAPGVLFNDTDVDGDPLTAVLVTDVSKGSLTLNTDGSFSYTPEADWNGATTFTYKANDGIENSATAATVTITVTPVNDAPVAQDITATTAEDTAVNITLIGTDVDGDALTYAVVAGPANGTVTITNNVAKYTPNANFNGTDSFTYKTNDGELDSNTATVTITVTPVNDAPVAQDITATTAEDTAVNITLLGTDVDGDPLTYEIVENPTNGTVTITNNVATYTPNANFNGTDTFTYKAKDATLYSNTATVTITVTAVNDAPVAQDIAVTTTEDTAIDITLIGTDIDGDSLTYTIVGTPTNGTVTLVGNVATFTPTANFNGTGSFTYKVNDGELDSNVATVTITVTAVNDAPVAQDIEVTTLEDTAVDITLIGTDVDGDSLTYTIVGTPTNGTVTLVGNVATYTPTANFNGTDSFTYKVNDGEFDSNTATVTITVTAVNDAPVAQDIAVTTLEGYAVDITLIGTDIEGDPLTYAVVAGPTNGAVTIAGNVATYTPTASFSGTDSFTYKANDGEADSDPATVTITVYDLPTISSPDLAGPYFVGALGSFSVTMTNPDGGTSYTSLSASIVIGDISLGDFTSIEVENPISGNWITLNAVQQGENVVINIPATDAFATGPGDSWTLNFRGAFKTPGNHLANGTLYCNDSGAPVAIGNLTDTMVVLAASPVIGSTNLSGPYFVGEPGSFTVTMTNPADGGTYTNLSAAIVIEDISLQDFTSIEVKHPVSGQWIELNAVQQGDNVVLNLGPTDAFAITPGKTWTLEFQGEFLTPGSYVATGTLYCHDSGEAIAIGRLTDTMVVYARPVISSTDVAGPYFVGEQREFHVTLDNTNGTTYTSLSAEIFVADIGIGDFESIEVLRPGTTDQWITLNPVVEGTGLRLVVGPTSNYPIVPNQNITLTFRGTFNTAGNYTGTGTLFSHEGTEKVAIASMTATMNVYERPVISSDDVAGPYFVGEQREFHVTLDNANGMTYTSMSASIFVDNIGMDDFDSVEVKHPVTGQWIALTPVVEGSGLRLVVGPTSNYEVGPNESVTLTFRVEFNTAGEYEATGTLYCHDSGEAIAIGSLTDTMVVYARPVISSDDIAGPYFVGELQEFHVTLDNTDGTTYTSMSASIFVDNIGLADFAVAEVKHPVTGQWITLTPVVEGTGLKLVVGPTSNYAVGPDDIVTLTFRVEFNTAGEYEATGTLYCHDSGTAVEIGSLTDTMVVYARPVISSTDLAGPYFVGELQEFHVTLDNTDGTTYTSMSAEIFVDNIGLDDFETAEVKHPVTGQWITLTPVVEGTGLKLVVGPTSNYAVGPDDIVTLTFRVEFNTAGSYPVTGILYCHDSGTAVEIGRLTDTMVVLPPPNVAPVAVDDAYTTSEDTLLSVDAPGILSNDTDANGDELIAILITNVSHGTLTLNANGSFTYMPETNFNGTDSFTYKVNDGELDSNVATVTITVTAVNDAPVAEDITVTTPEGTAIDITLIGSDVDGDTLTYAIVDGPANGTVTIVGNVVTYTPNANFNGTDSFTYKVNDGELDSNVATVTITVTAVNDAPVAEDITVTTPEDTAIDITLIGSDVDGDTLTYAIVDGPANGTVTIVGNVVTYTPNANFNGTDSFTYKVNDGELDSNVATVTITVTPVNDAPIAVDDAYTVAEDTVLTVAAPGVLENDSDVDGDVLNVALRSNVSHGVLVLFSDGSFTYTPDPDFFGTDSFTYDLITYPQPPQPMSGWTDWATVTITVTPVNDAPVLDEIPDFTIPELAPFAFIATATDVDDTELTFSLTNPPAGAAIDPETGEFTWTPTHDQVGDHDITLCVSDGELEDCQTFKITVTPVNGSPVAVEDEYTLNQDEVLTVDAPGVLENDSDPDDDPLTARLVTTTQHGTLILGGDGSFMYIPDAGYYGEDTFTYKAFDGKYYSEEVTVTLIVVKKPVLNLYFPIIKK